ncbi:MAG: YidC/Oxa1 family membrane protein insertase [Christensenellales bacterium]
MSFLNSLLLTLIKALHTLINNYALTIIVFTILIKLVVMPLNLKSRRSTMRMTTIQPKAAALQEKYKDDQEKLNQKLQELYRKEGINPMGSLPADAHFDGHPLRHVLRAAHVRQRAARLPVPDLLPQPGDRPAHAG